MENSNEVVEETKIIETDKDSHDGQNKCPKCGSTEIETNINTGKLRCNFCRYEFEPVKLEGMVSDISSLSGQVIASGASDIIADTNDVVTFKCSSCGAEVVVDTTSSLQARCHWCRNTLSVNEQIPNGAVPDAVLPFGITKKDAENEIKKFVEKRKFFAHPKFRQEFNTNNVLGVYFPYMLVDVNMHANLKGEGEILKRKYYVGSDEHKQARYDADLYNVSREFDLTINDLSIESNSDRLDNRSKDKTNNIINSIMPFDTENSVKYDANYLKGYTSERRDTNVENLKNIVDTQAHDIARFAANTTLTKYNRGVAWKSEDYDIKGEQWITAYLPVWLYSYQQISGTKKILHYVAVNARTKETNGSVPIHMPKLLITSILVEFFGVFLMMFIDFDENWVFLLGGVGFFLYMYAKYRNSSARHEYENDTKKEMSNLKNEDIFVKTRKGLSNSRISGCNNTSLNGTNTSNLFDPNNLKNNILDSVVSSNEIAGFIKDNIEKKGGK